MSSSSAPSSRASSSHGSASQVPHSSTGSRRHPPLQPPKPLFFVDRTVEEASRDPFRTPAHSIADESVPTTPRSDASNPFSPPASVVTFSAEQTVPGTPGIHHQRVSSGGSDNLHRPNTNGPQSSSTLRHAASVPSVPHVQKVLRGSIPRVDSMVRNSFMSPPIMARRATMYDGCSVSETLARPTAKRQRSTMLTGEIEKPWTSDKDVYVRISWWVTLAVAMIGVIGGAIRCYFGWRDVPRVGNLCLIMQDDFNTFDQNIWTRDVEMGGFGNGEFEMTTDSSNNSFVQDGKLYIVPTLTSDVIGYDHVLNGYTYNISGCTSSNHSACGAVSNSSSGAVINPVMSARLSTVSSHNIKYGKVEVVAKLPRGDWLWPAIWMMPVNDVYGAWPASGEIDIMEARGNALQGYQLRALLPELGPFPFLNGVAKTFGYWTNRRKTYADDYHTYSLEWTPTFMRMYVDTRLDHTLQLSFNEPFFERGDFPETIANGSNYIVTPDPWVNGTKNVAPFDQPFYLILDLAVGGTNGWFPDAVGDKPWLDASSAAMHDFAQAQDSWYATWPQDTQDRAFIIESVKMWQSC
ncbi:hypothetical protein EVJ58_g6670 [Rhodofomes roseus]|uniref:GH16 domain-containing protein n=1 Tax=Rhodofomes roseus TaxID=34475 RepID=A0A4Y9Y7J5_9APHY|nr:hypothetical protein EVJ58_g6670 [Rhodofomes roseus]